MYSLSMLLPLFNFLVDLYAVRYNFPIKNKILGRCLRKFSRQTLLLQALHLEIKTSIISLSKSTKFLLFQKWKEEMYLNCIITHCLIFKILKWRCWSSIKKNTISKPPANFKSIVLFKVQLQFRKIYLKYNYSSGKDI